MISVFATATLVSLGIYGGVCAAYKSASFIKEKVNFLRKKKKKGADLAKLYSAVESSPELQAQLAQMTEQEPEEVVATLESVVKASKMTRTWKDIIVAGAVVTVVLLILRTAMEKARLLEKLGMKTREASGIAFRGTYNLICGLLAGILVVSGAGLHVADMVALVRKWWQAGRSSLDGAKTIRSLLFRAEASPLEESIQDILDEEIESQCSHMIGKKRCPSPANSDTGKCDLHRPTPTKRQTDAARRCIVGLFKDLAAGRLKQSDALQQCVNKSWYFQINDWRELMHDEMYDHCSDYAALYAVEGDLEIKKKKKSLSVDEPTSDTTETPAISDKFFDAYMRKYTVKPQSFYNWVSSFNIDPDQKNIDVRVAELYRNLKKQYVKYNFSTFYTDSDTKLIGVDAALKYLWEDGSCKRGAAVMEYIKNNDQYYDVVDRPVAGLWLLFKTCYGGMDLEDCEEAAIFGFKVTGKENYKVRHYAMVHDDLWLLDTTVNWMRGALFTSFLAGLMIVMYIIYRKYFSKPVIQVRRSGARPFTRREIEQAIAETPDHGDAYNRNFSVYDQGDYRDGNDEDVDNALLDAMDDHTAAYGYASEIVGEKYKYAGSLNRDAKRVCPFMSYFHRCPVKDCPLNHFKTVPKEKVGTIMGKRALMCPWGNACRSRNNPVPCPFTHPLAQKKIEGFEMDDAKSDDESDRVEESFKQSIQGAFQTAGQVMIHTVAGDDGKMEVAPDVDITELKTSFQKTGEDVKSEMNLIDCVSPSLGEADIGMPTWRADMISGVFKSVFALYLDKNAGTFSHHATLHGGKLHSIVHNRDWLKGQEIWLQYHYIPAKRITPKRNTKDYKGKDESLQLPEGFWEPGIVPEGDGKLRTGMIRLDFKDAASPIGSHTEGCGVAWKVPPELKHFPMLRSYAAGKNGSDCALITVYPQKTFAPGKVLDYAKGTGTCQSERGHCGAPWVDPAGRVLGDHLWGDSGKRQNGFIHPGIRMSVPGNGR